MLTREKKVKSKIVKSFMNEVGENNLYNWFFKPDIKSHEEGTCKCDLTDGGYGYCYVGQHLEGDFTSLDQLWEFEKYVEEQLIEEMQSKGIRNLVDEIENNLSTEGGLNCTY